MLKHLEVILKTVERCNLNCSYCYFFNGSDSSYKKHPPFIRWDVIENTVRFLNQACTDFPLEKIVIDIHGGEPLLQKKSDFDAMCSYFRCHKLKLKLQTNGTLISPEWIDLFEKHQISIGVSIDGDQKAHDKFRIDHRGKGSYSAVKKGIDLLKENRQLQWGILCVINPAHSAKNLLSHFVDELGVKGMDFLLPDYTHDGFLGQSHKAEDFGRFLTELFYAWLERDDPEIKIRILESTIRVFLGKSHVMMGLSKAKEAAAITISSNGDISPHDALRTSVPESMSLGNVSHMSLKQFLHLPQIISLQESIDQIPSGCNSCRWKGVCGGGFANNRFKRGTGFDHPSIYCSGLKAWYQEIEGCLKKMGISYPG
ncbi:MAG: radical SAM protein [Parachlamydiales bacterium]|nr:radical SAM protein [Parachlamydiales bacterium]